MFRSLRYRNARLFFAGLAISNVGTWLQLTAMSLLVYRITDGDALIVGINAGLQFVPMLLLGAWAGAVADAHNRLRMSIITQSALAVQAIVLGLLDLTGAINVPVIFVLSLVLGLVNAFDNPARRGLVTELVDPVEIPNATSLNTAVMTGSRIFGPALAAVLVGAIGTAWCFLANGITFAAIIVSLLMIRTSEMFTVPPRPPGGQPVREGLRWVTGRRDMALLFGLLVVVSMFAFNYNVSLPKLADEQWGGEQRFGWVLAVTSIGSLTGSLLTARMRRVPMNWLLTSMVVLGIGAIGMAWAPNLAVGVRLVDPARHRRSRLHHGGERDLPAGIAVRHAQPVDGAPGGGVPRYDPDRQSHHRVDRRHGQRSVVAGLRGSDQPAVCSRRLGVPRGEAAEAIARRWSSKWLRSAGRPRTRD